jgi:mannosyltransferase
VPLRSCLARLSPVPLIELGTIVLVGLAARVFHLGRESLWLDEAASVWIASRPLRRVFAGEFTNPPLYYLLLHFWLGIFGTAEAAVRWLSVWTSVAAIVLTYALARRLYDQRVGLLSAAAMAVAPYQIYYAQEARCFSLLVCLTLASSLSFHVALARASGGASIGPWAIYCLTIVAALHTHFHAVFVVAAQNLVFALGWRAHRARLREWISVQMIALVAFAPWLLTMLLAAAAGGQNRRRYLLLKLPQAVVSFLVGDTLVPFDETAIQDIRGTLLSHLHLIAAFAIGFGIYLAAAALATDPRSDSRRFVWTMFLGPLLLPFIVSARVVIFDRRYVAAASPFLYIILATSMVYLHDLAIRRWRPALIGHLVAAGLVMAVLGVSLSNYYFNSRFGKEQWREVVAVVESGLAPGDLVVFEPDFVKVSYDYYARRPVAQLTIGGDIQDGAGPGWGAAAERIASHRRVWLIRSHAATAGVLPVLERTFSSEWHHRFPKDNGIDVYLLER